MQISAPIMGTENWDSSSVYPKMGLIMVINPQFMVINGD